jgi:four helix bundle protein
MPKAAARNFQDPEVWQKAHDLVLEICRLTESFPRHEPFGLTNQLRRAAVSVPLNIAEGFRKNGVAENVRFLNIAQGSLEEIRYYLILSQDLRYCESKIILESVDAVARMLHAYIRSMRSHHGVC